MMAAVQSFLSGFVSTLLFHQGVFHLLFLAGKVPRAAWNMDPVGPLAVPSVISLAFWGGLWGIALWYMIRGFEGPKHWLMALVLGAVLPSIVALFVVFPLKGMPMAGGWDPKILVGALLLNGAWGLGVAGLMAAMRRRMP